MMEKLNERLEYESDGCMELFCSPVEVALGYEQTLDFQRFQKFLARNAKEVA